MKVSQAMQLFFDVTEEYFTRADIVWGKQNQMVNPKNPLVMLTPGDLETSRHPSESYIGGSVVSAYQCRLPITVDLFTNGAEIEGADDRENTAVMDLLTFVDFLNSPYVTDKAFAASIEFMPSTNVTDASGVMYEDNYEFRARVEIMLTFMRYAVGRTGTAGESTIRASDGNAYPVGVDPEGTPYPIIGMDGKVEPTVGPDGEIIENGPISDEDYRNSGQNLWPEAEFSLVGINPDTGLYPPDGVDLTVDMDKADTEPSASGGGGETLAKINADGGYFTAVETPKEEPNNE